MKILNTSPFYVRPGQSVQNALDTLPPKGGIVVLAPGTHQGPITIRTNNTTLLGSKSTTLKAPAPAISVAPGATQITVRNITVKPEV